MSRNSSIHLDTRRWAEHRRMELQRLEAMQAAADAAGQILEPSAPEGAHCDYCDGEIIGGICSTCEAVFIDGIRQPKFQPKPSDKL